MAHPSRSIAVARSRYIWGHTALSAVLVMSLFVCTAAGAKPLIHLLPELTSRFAL